MFVKLTYNFLIASCIITLLVTGCASKKPVDPERVFTPPQIRMGPVIELFNVRIIRDKVKAIAGFEDEVHVLLASTELDQVIEIVVTPDGVVEHRIVLEDISPSYVDLAYDKHKRLNLLVEKKHMVFQSGSWQEYEKAPWQNLNLKVDAPHFVEGAPHLVWMFQADGKHTGAPWRIDIYGFGGHGGAIIWPWITHGEKTIMAAEIDDGYGPLLILEPESKKSAVAVCSASDREGNVTVIYNLSRSGILSDSLTRHYAQIDKARFFDYSEETQDTLQAGEKSIFNPVKGKSLFEQWVFLSQGDRPVSCSVDPKSGKVLLGLRYFIDEESVTGPLYAPSSETIFEARTTPGGNDSFHALVIGSALNSWSGQDWPVQYLLLTGDEWSAPVEVGISNCDSFWGWIWDALDIVKLDSGKIFLVWPKKNGIVGRWIELVE